MLSLIIKGSRNFHKTQEERNQKNL